MRGIPSIFYPLYKGTRCWLALLVQQGQGAQPEHKGSQDHKVPLGYKARPERQDHKGLQAWGRLGPIVKPCVFLP